MKLLTVIALILAANVFLFFSGEALLIRSSSTSDQWSRSCLYYFPVRAFEVVLPLSQDCPRWMAPR
jgi:hypothetical protein